MIFITKLKNRDAPKPAMSLLNRQSLKIYIFVKIMYGIIKGAEKTEIGGKLHNYRRRMCTNQRF